MKAERASKSHLTQAVHAMSIELCYKKHVSVFTYLLKPIFIRKCTKRRMFKVGLLHDPFDKSLILK